MSIMYILHFYTISVALTVRAGGSLLIT